MQLIINGNTKSNMSNSNNKDNNNKTTNDSEEDDNESMTVSSIFWKNEKLTAGYPDLGLWCWLALGELRVYGKTRAAHLSPHTASSRLGLNPHNGRFLTMCAA